MHFIAHLKAPIIWMFVRVISDFVPLFLKFRTASTVALAKKSSDKLKARDAVDKEIGKCNIIYPLGQLFITIQRTCSY